MALKRVLWWSGGGVLVALGAALLVYRTSDALRDDRQLFARSDLTAIAAQLNVYKERKGSYPTTEQGLRVLVTEQLFGELPRDGWQHDYVYHFPSTRYPDTFDLFSLGPDGVESIDDISLSR